jgi:hypothetical protein
MASRKNSIIEGQTAGIEMSLDAVRKSARATFSIQGLSGHAVAVAGRIRNR